MKFEDKLAELQSDMVSLCLELIDTQKADKIYIYGAILNTRYFLNAFFVNDNQIKYTNNYQKDSSILSQFFDYCYNDLYAIQKVCHEYDMKCPNELKMVYDVNTGSFDADYVYDENVFSQYDDDMIEAFTQWQNKINESLQK